MTSGFERMLGHAVKASLQQRVAEIKWFHSMDLGHGVHTPGRYVPADHLDRIGLPERLDGQTVLDVGAWDGFYSFECERRGGIVTAQDGFCWGLGDSWGSKAGFLLAREALASHVKDVTCDVLDVSPERVGGTFDLVLFLGVLYHMRHPLLALERVASVAKDQIILETHVDMLDWARPAVAFYENDECEGDVTNWCGPNPAAVEAMLRAVGFRRVVRHALWKTRLTVHAWKSES